MSLQKIQESLKAPKNQRNDFGKYNYRNCEDILAALKPLLAEYELTLTITDDVLAVGDRIYIKATCILSKSDKVLACTEAFAREPLSRKGMDESQITGTASSYARKYALNGMFLIDDTKDADSNEHHNDLAKPRVPHDKHLAESLKTIEKEAKDYEHARALGIPVYNYFKDWGQMEHAEKISKLMANLKDKFEQQKEQEAA